METDVKSQRPLQGRIHPNSLVAIRKGADGICGPLLEMLVA